LISRRSELDADVTHFADSIFGGQIVLAATQAKTIYDVGSGNGLPGLILALMAPERKFVLLDKDERKAEFLKLMAGRLELANVKIICGNFEDLPEGSVECAVSRGFASLSKALLFARRPMAPKSEYYHFKGSTWVREVAQIPSQICAFWTPKLVQEYELPITHARMAIVVTNRLG